MSEAFISKNRAVVGNKVAMMTKPTPMDIGYATIGHVAANCSQDDGQAVTANTRFFLIAMGWDIFQRVPFRGPWDCQVCARRNLKGKGKGKGGGKAGVKGGGRGVSFKGCCLACGKIGHRANECTERAVNSVEDVGDEGHSVSPIGGVWIIASVESREGHDEGFQMVSKRTSRSRRSSLRPRQC